MRSRHGCLQKIESGPELRSGGVLVKSQLIMAGRPNKHWWRDLASTHAGTDRRNRRLRRRSQTEETT